MGPKSRAQRKKQEQHKGRNRNLACSAAMNKFISLCCGLVVFFFTYAFNLLYLDYKLFQKIADYHVFIQCTFHSCTPGFSVCP